MTTKIIANSHGIRDNYGCGKVADFLVEKISDGSVMSVVSAYFTIYAYEALAERLDCVEARMALVDIAATAEDNILQSDELRELIQEDLRYRDKQLLRLKDEVLDLEDFNESVALNEFTLDDFRMELATYIEANREKLEEAMCLFPTRSTPVRSQRRCSGGG